MAAIKSQTTVSGDVLAEPSYRDPRDGKGASLSVMLMYSPRCWDERERRYRPVEGSPVRVKLQFSGSVATRVRDLFARGVLRVGSPVHAHGRLSDKPFVREFHGRLEASHVFHADDIDLDLVTLITRDPLLTAMAACA